jgi:hypothetical protein
MLRRSVCLSVCFPFSISKKFEGLRLLTVFERWGVYEARVNFSGFITSQESRVARSTRATVGENAF